MDRSTGTLSGELCRSLLAPQPADLPPERQHPPVPCGGCRSRSIYLSTILVALSRWRLLFAIGVTLVLAGVAFGGGGIHTERTFFGVYRVTDAPGEHALVHGTTMHGIQYTDPELRRAPAMYYHRAGPIGEVFAARATELDRVAVVGLGVGTLATYGLPGQQFTFYEIDPAVVAIARNPELFTYLADSPADVEVIVGDGRLGLAADRNTYDLLIMDAFSSDAVPVHLMTSEALALYVQRLAPGGVIAFHVTSRHLELEPVLGTVARSLGLMAIAQSDGPLTPDGLEGKAETEWVLIARSSRSSRTPAGPRRVRARCSPMVRRLLGHPRRPPLVPHRWTPAAHLSL